MTDTHVRAVRGLQESLGSSRTNYRVMPGGVLEPTADDTCAFIKQSPPMDIPPFHQSLILAQQAIFAAENVDPTRPNDPTVRAHLAIALHPYQYGTPAFVNFAHYVPAVVHGDFTHSVCHRLDKMLQLWQTGNPVPPPWPIDLLHALGGLPYASLQGLPIFFTEVNWTGQVKGKSAQQDWDPNNKGSYLVDLFTWLNDGKYHLGTPGQSPLRVLWFDGANFDDSRSGSGLLGIYDAGFRNNPPPNPETPPGQLRVTIPQAIFSVGPRGTTPTWQKYLGCVNHVLGENMLSRDFLMMHTAACW